MAYDSRWFVTQETYSDPMTNTSSDVGERSNIMRCLHNQHHTRCIEYCRRNHYTHRHGNNALKTRRSKQPLIASFNHPLRKRVREIQTYNIDNLLGYGPQWVNKDHIRNLCSATKTTPSRNQSMGMLSSSEMNLPSMTAYVDDQVDESPKMPKVEHVIHSYILGGKTVAVDPRSFVGQSTTTKSLHVPKKSPSSPHRSFHKFLLQDSFTGSSRDRHNEVDLSAKYSQRFDNLSSPLPGCTTMDDIAHLKNEVINPIKQSTQQMNYLESRGEFMDSFNKKVKNQDYSYDRQHISLQTLKANNESTRLDGKTNNLNCNKERKDFLNTFHLEDDGEKVDKEEKDERSRTPSQHDEQNRQLIGKKSELFSDKLVNIVKDYIKHKMKENGKCGKDKTRQENVMETKDTMEKMNAKQKESFRRKRIEVLRRSLSEQESALAKLKRQHENIFNKEKRLSHDSQEVNSSVENKASRHKLLNSCQSNDDESVSLKKPRFSVGKLNPDIKTSWKRRLLSDWSCSTTEQ